MSIEAIHNSELEKNIIYSMLEKPEIVSEVINLIEAEHFYERETRTIFECYKSIVTRNLPVEIPTLLQELNQKPYIKNFSNISPSVYISQIINETIAPCSAYKYYCENLIKLYNRNVISEKLSNALTKTNDITTPYEETLEKYNNLVSEIFTTIKTSQPETMENILIKRLKYFETISKDKKKIEAIATGYGEIDDMTLGLIKKHLTIIAGRPGMGKTAFMLNLAYNISSKNTPVGIISLEQNTEELIDRLLCIISGINSLEMRKGNFKENDWQKLTEAAEILCKLPIYIIHIPGARIMEIIVKMRQMKENYNCGIIFIDHLDEVDRNDNTENITITNILANYAKKIKDQANYLDINATLLHQINRSVETRTDKRPKMSDLRNSGDIEQKADEIYLLYRDKKYYPEKYESDDEDLIEIIVGKQKNGPIGKVELLFLEESMKFESYYQ